MFRGEVLRLRVRACPGDADENMSEVFYDQ